MTDRLSLPGLIAIDNEKLAAILFTVFQEGQRWAFEYATEKEMYTNEKNLTEFNKAIEKGIKVVGDSNVVEKIEVVKS